MLRIDPILDVEQPTYLHLLQFVSAHVTSTRIQYLRSKYPGLFQHPVNEQLLRLFRLIDGAHPKLNEECDVARYNGGLFNPAMHPRIDEWRVPDRALADVLRQLVFAQPPARRSAKQLQIATDEAIDYSTLEVRQLGDIYEGLLGAKLAEDGGRLVMLNADGSNHRDGIYYTPDWIVRHLLDRTLGPLINAIESRADVQAALKAKSEEKGRNNSFAHALLTLNLVDPAMGSGHFLVRATEWLAKKIHEHPTTRRMTERYGATGDRTRDQILAADRVPVHKDFPQERAEIGYWRRRIVEACIYGVDINPLAVELTKLSLWLTCIAVDEPLNFLDHHLRPGNSLLFARVAELDHPPLGSLDPEQKKTFSLGDTAAQILRAAIAENTRIEGTLSTEMALVKAKEDGWKKVRGKIEPLLRVGDTWLAAMDGALTNPEDYRLLALHNLNESKLLDDQSAKGFAAEDHAKARALSVKCVGPLATKRAALTPLHWELEFPDVFFAEDGSPKAAGGFDAVLGNPPYVSLQTSGGAGWRSALEKRAKYVEDLYVHFTELGFDILREGGRFGFVVSDTFFTLDTKLRMRELLQRNTLDVIGQCDPFDATVDAAIFAATKGPSPTDHHVLFVQARPRRNPGTSKLTDPEPWLEKVPAPDAMLQPHGEVGPIRFHRVPASLYVNAHNRVFFEPRPPTLALFKKFNDQVAALNGEWWERIKDSKNYTKHAVEIYAHGAALKPGETTLVGLIAEGGVGLQTSDNPRFLGYLEKTPAATEVLARREKWTHAWMAHPKVAPVFSALLLAAGGDPAKPTANGAAWEASVGALRQQFDDKALGCGKTDLYRIVPAALIAGEGDFKFAWTQRKSSLLTRWQKAGEFKEFWSGGLMDGLSPAALARLQQATPEDIDDQPFCDLSRDLTRWINGSPSDQRAARREALGLRPGETYADADDAARIAVIYNGLSGRGTYVPFRKGDPNGNRWAENSSLYISWSAADVDWLFGFNLPIGAKQPYMRNPHLFFTEGVTWTRVANHVAVKARYQPACVFDTDSVRLTPIADVLHPLAFLAVFNSDIFSFLKMRFFQHTAKWELGPIRQMPFVMPSPAQATRLRELAERATEAKRCEFANQPPTQDLAASCRVMQNNLLSGAPKYLHPPAQEQLLATPESCLAIIELSVNWEAEKLYGVEGQGPFDEF